MKRKIICIVLCLALCLTLFSCSQKTADKISIAVVTKSTSSDFWHNVSYGVESAATEYNVSVSFNGPSNEEDYVTQNNLIERAVENGADAIVFSAIDYTKSTQTIENAIAKGVKVVMIDSNIDSDKVSLFVGTDNMEAGRMAAKAAREEYLKLSHSDGAMNVGIVNFDKASDNGQQRERGFRNELAKYDNVKISETINVDSNTEDAKKGTLDMLERNPEINCVVGFNEWMTLGIGEAIKESGKSESVCAVGFDSNVVSIGMMETGEIDSLIVQNPFAMGYLGVTSAYGLVSGKNEITDGNIVTSTSCINRENMFDEASQKIMFRF